MSVQLQLPIKTTEQLFNHRLYTKVSQQLASIPDDATPETLTEEQETSLLLALGVEWDYWRGKIVITGQHTLTRVEGRWIVTTR